MTTECTQFVFGFHPQKRREIRAQFDGGAITSDGGGLLLREVEKRVGMLRQFAACFTDYRNPDLIEHQVEEMVAQRQMLMPWQGRLEVLLARHWTEASQVLKLSSGTLLRILTFCTVRRRGFSGRRLPLSNATKSMMRPTMMKPGTA